MRDILKMRGMKFIGEILEVFEKEIMKILRIKIVEKKVEKFVRNIVWNKVE
jgi:hypothetical protein